MKLFIVLVLAVACVGCGGGGDDDPRDEADASDESLRDADTGADEDDASDEEPVGSLDADVEDSAVDETGMDSSTVDAIVDESDAAVQPDADAPDVDVPDIDASDANVGDAGDAGEPPGPETVDICGTVVEVDEYSAEGSEWIIDVATYTANSGTNPTGTIFLESYIGYITSSHEWVERPLGCMDAACFDESAYEPQLFDESDTARAVLVGFQYALGANGAEPMFAVADFFDLQDVQLDINERRGSKVVLYAPAIMPNDQLSEQLERMDNFARYADAWAINTKWTLGGSTQPGFYMDDAAGRQVIERALELEVATFLLNKGLPRSSESSVHSSPRDIGPIAAAYPAARFVVQQSAFEHGLSSGDTTNPAIIGTDMGWGPEFGQWPEGPYDDSDVDVQALYPLNRGVNSLITSLLDSDVEPNENVYASLDGVWAELLTRPIEAAHVLGKLLLYVGEDNVLWGTQSTLYGGPDPQIEAFRDFEIPESMRNAYGYPELTPARKAKILGLNAARIFCLPPP